MYGTIFFIYGVGLWYGGELIVQSRERKPDCVNDPTAGGCFAGGDAMLVRCAGVQGCLPGVLCVLFLAGHLHLHLPKGCD